MFGSTVLEIAVGLIFVYLVFALICTSVNEYLAQFVGLRAENLAQAIYGMFPGEGRFDFAEAIYDHPLIQGLSRKQIGFDGFTPAEVPKRPSAIPGHVFSTVVLDLLGIKEPPGTKKSANLTPNTTYDAQIVQTLQPFLNAANGSLDKARQNVEVWYEHAMERAVGWYKRKAQVMSFLVAFGIVFVANADSIMLFERLWVNPTQRTELTALAQKAGPNDKQLVQQSKAALTNLFGWAPASEQNDPRRVPEGPEDIVLKIFGLSITAVAVSLGAPFWFDVLSKVMTVRSGGPLPDPKARVASSDGLTGSANAGKNGGSLQAGKEE